MADSPTARTLRALRNEGWLAQVVEKWNPHARIKQDLFGFIDVLAIKPNTTLGVQATSGTNHAARVNKILAADHTRSWLEAGNELEVWAWRKLKNDRGRWTPKITKITVDML